MELMKSYSSMSILELNKLEVQQLFVMKLGLLGPQRLDGLFKVFTPVVLMVPILMVLKEAIMEK